MSARQPFLVRLSQSIMAIIALALISAPLAAADRAAHAETMAMASGDCVSHQEGEADGPQSMAAEDCIAACLAGQIAVAASLAVFAQNVPHGSIMSESAPQQPHIGLTPGLDPPPPRFF